MLQLVRRTARGSTFLEPAFPQYLLQSRPGPDIASHTQEGGHPSMGNYQGDHSSELSPGNHTESLFLQTPSIISLTDGSAHDNGATVNTGKSGRVNFDKLKAPKFDYFKRRENEPSGFVVQQQAVICGKGHRG